MNELVTTSSSAPIPAGAYQLRSPADWPSWFMQLRFNASARGVWELVDPDAKNSLNPLTDALPVPKYPLTESTPPELDDPEAQLFHDTDPVDQSTELAKSQYNHEMIEYKLKASEWAVKGQRVQALWNWVNLTVAQGILSPIQMQLITDGNFNLQELVRSLRQELAPSHASTLNSVRVEYRTHLEAAKQGRITPAAWFEKWSFLYMRAKAYKLPEVTGVLAAQDFLEAVARRMAPDWARTMQQSIIMDSVLGKPELTLDQVSRIFGMLIHEHTIRGNKDNPGIFATFGGRSDDRNNNNSDKNKDRAPGCPCRQASDRQHRWKPTDCRALEAAVRGNTSPPFEMSNHRRNEILKRLNHREHKDTKRAIENLGWFSTESTSSVPKIEFPGKIQAALIDPKMMIQGPSHGVYNLMPPSMDFDLHPLSNSTILDNGAATHLVNNKDLLVPGSFISSDGIETVEAGTQAFPIAGRGARLLKNALNGARGRNTEDLLLQDVVLVEGFHVNIVSEARLNEKKVWYLGLDCTLRVGTLERSIVLAKLRRAHNLTFLEYNPLPMYLPSSINNVISRRSWETHPRSDSEGLWHARAGHLGPEALRALVHRARNVRISGTPRIQCEHCATTHAKQVISRRKREKPDKPFWRIGWDLFDMPMGRSGELWMMVIKEYYSGKLFVYTLQGKTLSEIMRVITNFTSWVNNQYRLRICRITQDNDTATLPWRGSSAYEEWALEQGIEIERIPPYTHEPNGGPERAGQEIITKSIKMASGAKLPEKLWPEVVEAAAWLYNMSPSHANNLRSPNEQLDSWFTRYFRWYDPARSRSITADLRPDWSGIYAYGCRAYPLNRERAAGRNKRSFKVTPRGHIGYLVGYRASNIYRIWIPQLDQVITTRNVAFDERLFYDGNHEQGAISVEEATALVTILHEPGEIYQAGEAIELPTDEQELSRTGSTERQLGGDTPQQRASDGQSEVPETEEEDTERAARLAGELLEIRSESGAQQGILTPDPTPERELLVVRQEAPLDDEGGDQAGSSREVHSTGEESRPDDTTSSQSIADNSEPAITTDSPASRVSAEAEEPRVRRAYNRRVWGPPTRASRRIRDREIDELADDYRGQFAVIDLDGSQTVDWIIEPLVLKATKLGHWNRELLTVNAVIAAAALRPMPPTKEPRRHRDELPPLPKKWRDLQNHPLGALFIQAAKKEIAALIAKGTWKEVRRSSADRKPLPLKWVFTYKLDQDGYFIKCKARICVRGDLQSKDSIDSTYATTLAARSFRTMVAIASQFDLELRHHDVAGAFLNASREHQPRVLCELPDGFKKEGWVVELLRALYGLRDSPVLWYQELSSTLRKLGLTSSKEEPCLFYDDERRIVLLFYVDDILLAYHRDDSAAAEALMSSLTSVYQIEDHGEASWFLGIRIIRDREARTITLAHDSYIDKIAAKFEVAEKGTFPHTPMPIQEMSKFTGEATKQSIKAYQERVGSILYTAIMIRPDVAFAASQLSHFLTNPGPQHFRVTDQVLAYLYRTKHLGIQYGAHEGSDLVMCGDASFADDTESRRSSQGYIMQLFGGPVIWRAARQATVTTSTTEAELLGLESTVKESMALKRFLRELRLDLGVAWEIFCDNQQTIRLVTNNERITTRLRHVDIQNMWLKQEHAKGTFQVRYIKTSEMPADGLTKALPGQAFDRFVRHLNLVHTREITEDITEGITGEHGEVSEEDRIH